MAKSPNALDLLRKDHRAVLALLRKFERSRDEREQRLGEHVSMHVREEEERIFPVVEKLGIDLAALGEELLEWKRGAYGHAGHARDDAPAAADTTKDDAQERMKAGNPSNFFRLDSPHREDG